MLAHYCHVSCQPPLCSKNYLQRCNIQRPQLGVDGDTFTGSLGGDVVTISGIGAENPAPQDPWLREAIRLVGLVLEFVNISELWRPPSQSI